MPCKPSPYVLVKVLTPAFFAREDTATPVRVAIFTMAVNVVLNLALISSLRHVGMALSTAIAAWCNVAVLGYILHKRGYFVSDTRLRSRTPRIVLSGLVMAAALYQAQGLIWEPGMDLWRQLAAVCGFVGLGLAVFGAAAHLSGAAKIAEIRTMMRKRA